MVNVTLSDKEAETALTWLFGGLSVADEDSGENKVVAKTILKIVDAGGKVTCASDKKDLKRIREQFGINITRAKITKRRIK